MITIPVELTPPQKTGNYTLGFSMATLKREGYVPFADGFTKEIQVIPQDGISSAEFGSIFIDSVPSGALVSLNGKPSGVTPLTIPDLNPAKYSLDISLDLQTRTVSVPVDPSSVSHISVDFSSDQKPVVRSEHLQRYTLLGWILGNIPLIVITIVIILAGLQVMMLDTKRFPEEHILRKYAKPFTLVNVKFDGESRGNRKGSDATPGKAGSDTISGEGSDQGGKKGSTSSSSGRGGTKSRSVSDKKRKSDQISKKKEQADLIFWSVQLQEPVQTIGSLGLDDWPSMIINLSCMIPVVTGRAIFPIPALSSCMAELLVPPSVTIRTLTPLALAEFNAPAMLLMPSTLKL